MNNERFCYLLSCLPVIYMYQCQLLYLELSRQLPSWHVTIGSAQRVFRASKRLKNMRNWENIFSDCFIFHSLLILFDYYYLFENDCFVRPVSVRTEWIRMPHAVQEAQWRKAILDNHALRFWLLSISQRFVQLTICKQLNVKIGSISAGLSCLGARAPFPNSGWWSSLQSWTE